MNCEIIEEEKEDQDVLKKVNNTNALYLKSKVRYEPPPVGANMAKTLLEGFLKHSERVLLVDVAGKEELTGSMLYDKVGRISTSLIKKLNFKPGQVCLTLCEHSGSEIVMVLGLVMAGGAIYGSNPEDGYSEEKMLCNLVRPDYIVCQSRIHQNVMKLKQNKELKLDNCHIIWVDNPIKKTTTRQLNSNNGSSDSSSSEFVIDYESIIKRDQVTLFEDLLMNEELDEKLLKDVVYNQIDPKKHVLTYMMTSGSTDRPKVVKSTHEELMHGLYSMISANKYEPQLIMNKNYENNNNNNNNHDNSNDEDEFINKKKNYLLPIGKESVFAGDLPLDHGAGINTMFLSIHNGSKFIIIPAYQVDIFWQSVHDFRITSSIASTTFTFKLFTRLKELIDSNETNKWNLDCFKHIVCCGSKMAFIDLVNEIKKFYKNINICQCYGATEMGFMSMLPIRDSKTHLHSIGYLFPGMIAKVVDYDTGKLCGPNERGQLHIWSRSKFKEYMCHPSDNPRHMIERCHDSEGFYITGDQVHYDEQERFYIHGRFKDTLFLMQDWKILPAELEEVILEHPLVEVTAVVGIPDRDLPGCDAPRAFVKLINPNTSPKFNQLSNSTQNKHKQLIKKLTVDKDLDFISKDIYQFVADRTAKPKHLKGGVRIIEEFPLVGLLNKIDRKALKLIE